MDCNDILMTMIAPVTLRYIIVIGIYRRPRGIIDRRVVRAALFERQKTRAMGRQ